MPQASSRALLGSVVFVLATVAALLRPSESRASAPRARHVRAAETTAREESTRAVYPSAPVALARDGAREVLAFPPAPTAASSAATVVYLHGARGLAEKGCPHFRAGAREVGWLLCPEALEAEPNGLWSWGADLRAQARVLAETTALARANGARDELPVIVGFSQGAYVTVDLIKTHLGRARGVVLLGADVHPDVRLLREAGVRRVALGAGRQDAAFRPLQAEVARLQAEGMSTRFVDLGSVGHTYATETPEVLREVILWAAAWDAS